MDARRRDSPQRVAAGELIYKVTASLIVAMATVLVLYFAIPLATAVWRLGHRIAPSADGRASLPNYAHHPWAAKHFAEFHQLETEYVSYLGWRRRPFAGETMTIDAATRTRVTPQARSAAGSRTVYFFGGSTMWGSGSRDAETIPAAFQRRAGGRVWNLAETAWTAHQSLNQLIKLYTEGHRPNLVVFYDGANEVIERCRSDNDFWATSRQGQIRRALAYAPQEAGYYLQPIWAAGARLRAVLGLASDAPSYDCDVDGRKANLVAEQLMSDWKVASLLVASYGGRFHAYLQPVAYLGRPRLDHLRLDPSPGKQFEAVYPRIRRRMAMGSATDLSAIFDRDEYIYVDFCHVSPNGNEIVADRLVRDLGTSWDRQ